MPYSRPMPSIGPRCYELRINDKNLSWRIIYRIDPDAIIILHIFDKKTNKIPKQGVEICQSRIKLYDSL
jgi:phage-related protein